MTSLMSERSISLTHKQFPKETEMFLVHGIKKSDLWLNGKLYSNLVL